MTLYRVWVHFEPRHPRLNGRANHTTAIVRGVYRVNDSHTSDGQEPAVVTSNGYIAWNDEHNGVHTGILSPRARKVGTLANPRKILAEYQRALRA